MKIGILTFHRSINYGAFMQCFSLITRLKKDFSDCVFEVVDFTPERVINSYSNIINQAKTEERRRQYTERSRAFQEVYPYLNLSPQRLETDNYYEIADYLNQHYDVVIVGSDAVWNWTTRGFPNVYFLNDYHGVKFSYAASAHGLHYKNMTQEQRSYLQKAFNDFSYIGVRDVTTENMVRYVFPEKRIYHNCDPTAFLNLDNVPCDMSILRNKMEKHGVDFSKPLVGIMTGGTIGREIKKKYGNKIQIVAVCDYNPYADVYLYDLTPFEWAHVFSFFKLTLTCFFHGTMLSLKNGTPVIPIETLNSFSAVYTTKISDLLNRLELTEWREEINHLSCNKLQRVFYHFGLKTDKDLWERVFDRMNLFLKNDYSEIIFKKMNQEAKYYDSFHEALREYISEQHISI